ncbi:nuclear transport factor 2 family protein [Phenylobacterium sp.]|uniref:nuclear transport factor 2 family protein n=1 Tax=Phenylobacterium sp. TaxID=1871053 RepID=UPI0028128C3B|nr:nuclear transport factor 2 family protein [Phenylobacterium sp.]
MVAGAAGVTGAQADLRGEAEATLRAFLKAFENDDVAMMEAAFVPEAASFDLVVAAPGVSAPPNLEAFRRQPGMPASMRALVERTPKPKSGPPYRRLEPKDLLIQVEGSTAVCTFHLEGPTSLGRRTIVLVRRGTAWKILHIHASNARSV